MKNRLARILGIKGPETEAAARLVNVYVDRGRNGCIVARTSKNEDGIYFEQYDGADPVQSLDSAALGHAFERAFDGFTLVDADLREWNSTDWPAFKVSGRKSVKDFKKSYILISCEATNETNLMVRASTPHPGSSNVELSVQFNPKLEAEAIGEKLMELIKLAIEC